MKDFKESLEQGVNQQPDLQDKEIDQRFRIAVAKGLSTPRIGQLLGITNLNLIIQKKKREHILGRREIIELLPYKTDKEIAGMAKILDVSQITLIREDEKDRQRKATDMIGKQSKQVARAKKKIAKPLAENRGQEKPTAEKLEKEVEAQGNLASATEQRGRKEQPALIKRQDEAEFLRLAGTLTSAKSIAKKLGMTEEEVRRALEDYDIFDRDEVVEWLEYKSDTQIAIMGNLKDYTIVEKVRKEEKEKQGDVEEQENVETLTKRKASKEKEERIFIRMARRYEKIDKMVSALSFTKFEIILKLRKLNIRTRQEVEELIEAGALSDSEIAGENGNINAVSRIRRMIVEREKLINSISEKQQASVKGMLDFGQVLETIANNTRVDISVIRAIQEKRKRNNDEKVTGQRKEINFKATWRELETKIKLISRESPDTAKDLLKYTMDKILALYDEMLTQRHCAYIAYGYMKMGRVEEGIEFAKDYLDLTDRSEAGVKHRIVEIQNETDKEKPVIPNSSKRITVECADFACIGE